MSNKYQINLNNHPHQIIFHLYRSHCTFIIMTAVLPDDEEFFQDGPASPQDRPTSPGPDLVPEAVPEPQPPVPEAARRAVAHVRPISIADIVRDISCPNPMRRIMRVIRDLHAKGDCCCKQ